MEQILIQLSLPPSLPPSLSLVPFSADSACPEIDAVFDVGLPATNKLEAKTKPPCNSVSWIAASSFSSARCPLRTAA